MANDLATTATERRVALTSISAPNPDPQAEEVVRWATSGAFTPAVGPMELINYPGGHDRETLVKRRAYLAAAFMQFSVPDTKALIADMLGCYTVMRDLKGKDLDAILRKYVAEMKLDPMVPTWAVARACNAIRTGMAPNISFEFVPNTIQVRLLALTFVERWKVELRRVAAVLAAKKYVEPVSDEERERVRVQLNELAATLRANEEANKEARVVSPAAEALARSGNERRTRAIQAEYERDGVKPVTVLGSLVSSSLLKSIGRYHRTGVSNADEAGH